MTDMIMPTHRVRILVATQPVDFRNYAECIIMQSVWQLFHFCQHLNGSITLHIFFCFEHRLASRAACRAP